MCIIPNNRIIITKFFHKSPCTTCKGGSEVEVLKLPPLNEGLVLKLKNSIFSPTNFTHQKHLKLNQCLEID